MSNSRITNTTEVRRLKEWFDNKTNALIGKLNEIGARQQHVVVDPQTICAGPLLTSSNVSLIKNEIPNNNANLPVQNNFVQGAFSPNSNLSQMSRMNIGTFNNTNENMPGTN